MENSISPNDRLQHLVELAQNITFDPHKPLRYYIILVNELQQRGKKAILDKRFEEAFVTLVRMLLVIISYIPKHPDYQIIDQTICKDLAALKERYFSITSQIKQLLRKKYQYEYDTAKFNRNSFSMKKSPQVNIDENASNSIKSRISTTSSGRSFNNDSTSSLEFSYKSIANKLKHPSNYTTTTTTTTTKGNYPGNNYNQINSKLSNVSYKELLSEFNNLHTDKSQQSHMEDHIKSSNTSNYDCSKVKNKSLPNEIVHLNDSYSSPLPELYDLSSSSSSSKDSLSASIQFNPLNEYFNNNTSTNVLKIDRSLKPDCSKMHIVTNSNNSSLLDSSLLDSSLLDSSLIDSSIHDDSNGSHNILTTSTIFDDSFFDTKTTPINNNGTLCPVIIPKDTADRFSTEALTDIKSNIETLGILAGVLINNTYVLTHILIPNQSGTSDSCEMLSENEIFLYQIENNLLTLGWIHTHPTQSCFLSSVDLHTHYSYQCQLEEAIAIVVSHKNNCFSNYVFHLTSKGMETIKSCKSRGFHPHDNNLFEVCEYVVIDHKRSIKIVDMRLSTMGYL